MITGTLCSGTSVSWGFRSAWKRASCAENLFSLYGVRLGEYDGASHHRACTVQAEPPEFLQWHDGGTTETFSEAPGAYGIRSHSRTARVASHETTSALVTLTR